MFASSFKRFNFYAYKIKRIQSFLQIFANKKAKLFVKMKFTFNFAPDIKGEIACYPEFKEVKG